MIKRSAELAVREREEVRGGVGKLYFHDFLTKEEAKGAGSLFSKTVIPAGSSIGEHRHDGEFEVYYVLAGTVEVLDGGVWQTMRRGDMHLCASGESHALKNTSAEEAQILMLILNDQSAK